MLALAVFSYTPLGVLPFLLDPWLSHVRRPPLHVTLCGLHHSVRRWLLGRTHELPRAPLVYRAASRISCWIMALARVMLI